MDEERNLRRRRRESFSTPLVASNTLFQTFKEFLHLQNEESLKILVEI